MIRLALALWVAGLGVGGPVGWFTVDSLDYIFGGDIWDNSGGRDFVAKVALMSFSENALISKSSINEPPSDVATNVSVGSKGCGRINSDGVRHFAEWPRIGKRRAIQTFTDAHPAIDNHGVADVVTFNSHNEQSSIGTKSTFKFNGDSSTLMVFSNIVSLARFTESGPDKANPDNAKNESGNGRPEHSLGPVSRVFLGLQIPNFALIPVFLIGIGFGILGFKGVAYAADTRRDILMLPSFLVSLAGCGIASGVLTYWLDITR